MSTEPPANPTTNLSATDYAQLGPEQVLQAAEHFGLSVDGHLLALNSFENRVYKVGLVDADSMVIKFYRPNRWNDAQILEEHQYSAALADAEIPVIAPLEIESQTLLQHNNFRFAIFPCVGGRAPDLENFDQLKQLARLLGRLHMVGAERPFVDRPALDIETFGTRPREYVLNSQLLPRELETVYQDLTQDLLTNITVNYQRAGNPELIRCHGDCHAGNLLIGSQGPHIVDLDDARMAPRVQDLWMLLPGEGDDFDATLTVILDAYTEFSHFDARELHLIEALRTLRIIHYYAWLARRWDDPAFPIAFPWFNSQRCWEEHILALREQAAKLYEPAPLWLR
ncbi:MAG: serine/threonine protein kinase [Arenicellaceae bacterium]|nr:serine/threonine protein kinase [Arenicellaceae bacterium]